MNRREPLKVVMTASGVRKGQVHVFISSTVTSQGKAAGKYIEIISFAVDSTRSPFGLLRNTVELGRVVRKAHPDILHAQWGSTVSLVSLFAAARKCPVVISFCGGDLLADPTAKHMKGRLRSKLIIGISRLCARYANAIIVKSPNLCSALPQKARSVARILPNGVDVNRFKPISKAVARRALDLDPKSHIVLFNRSQVDNEEYKCTDLATAAVSFVKERLRGSNVVFLAISNEPHAKMPLYLNAADLLLLTSISEGSPNIVKEAMACDLPVVTVECGDVAKRLKDVVPSYIVSRDPKTLADAIESILVNGQRSNGRAELMKQGLDQENVTQALIKLYRAILEQKEIRSAGYALRDSSLP